nr:unknown [Medicago truncatula]
MDEVVTDLEKLQVQDVNGCNQNRSRRRSADYVTHSRTTAAYPQRSASMFCT